MAKINYFIDQKGDINTIDLTKFSRDILKPLSRKYILSAIDNLNIACYADSVNRVGKENSFWNDFVITNLPKENYLRNVFEKILRENCQYFSSTNDIFTIKEYGDNEYAPA